MIPGFAALSLSYDRNNGRKAADHASRSNPLLAPEASTIVRNDVITFLLFVT